jgi:hypothetical protein
LVRWPRDTAVVDETKNRYPKIPWDDILGVKVA